MSEIRLRIPIHPAHALAVAIETASNATERVIFLSAIQEAQFSRLINFAHGRGLEDMELAQFVKAESIKDQRVILTAQALGGASEAFRTAWESVRISLKAGIIAFEISGDFADALLDCSMVSRMAPLLSPSREMESVVCIAPIVDLLRNDSKLRAVVESCRPAEARADSWDQDPFWVTDIVCNNLRARVAFSKTVEIAGSANALVDGLMRSLIRARVAVVREAYGDKSIESLILSGDPAAANAVFDAANLTIARDSAERNYLRMGGRIDGNFMNRLTVLFPLFFGLLAVAALSVVAFSYSSIYIRTILGGTVLIAIAIPIRKWFLFQRARAACMAARSEVWGAEFDAMKRFREATIKKVRTLLSAAYRSSSAAIVSGVFSEDDDMLETMIQLSEEATKAQEAAIFSANLADRSISILERTLNR